MAAALCFTTTRAEPGKPRPVVEPPVVLCEVLGGGLVVLLPASQEELLGLRLPRPERAMP